MKEKLAEKGGKPVRKDVLNFVPTEADLGREEIDAVLQVLNSGKLSQLTSEKVGEFEEAFAKYYGVDHAIAVTSGTTALHVSLAATGLGPSKSVVLPPYTFMASANAILHQNCVPVFADVDPATYTLDPEHLEKTVTKKTGAVVPVHILGQPADMEAIMEVAKRHKLVVVEDCAQANGAEYKGKKVGSFGDCGCFSFYLNKHMTTGGEGGMIITNSGKLAKKARSIANHGRVEVSPYPNVPAHNVYTSIGYNYRMTALQAAMGLVQLRRLDKFIEKRRKNADYLAKHIKKIRGLKPAFVRKDVKHVYWVYGALVVDEELGVTRDRFRKALLAEGVNSEGYCPIPVHLQVFFRKKQGYGGTTFPFESPWNKEKVTYKKGLCPKAEKLSSQDLLLPVYQTLSERDLKDVVVSLEKVADNAERLRD
jgi:perosamine synthetase